MSMCPRLSKISLGFFHCESGHLYTSASLGILQNKSEEARRREVPKINEGRDWRNQCCSVTLFPPFTLNVGNNLTQ